MKSSPSTRFVNIEEAARLSGMSVPWWRCQVMKRRVPFIKIGRSVRFDVNDIEKMLEAGRVDAVSKE